MSFLRKIIPGEPKKQQPAPPSKSAAPKQKFSPQEEFDRAQKAFDQQDLHHAIYHLSWALSADPKNADYLALLDRIVRASREPLKLVTMAKGVDYPNAAVSAYIHGRFGLYDQALAYLAEILAVASATQYLVWAAEWLGEPERVDTISVNALLRFAISITRLYRDRVDNPDAAQALEAMLPAFKRAQANNSSNGMFAGIVSTLYRKLGHTQEAIEIAQAGYNAEPGHQTAVFLYGAYKFAGQSQKALEMCYKALEYNPNDVTVRLDIGDMLCANNRAAEGVQEYERVLKTEPNHPWAKPHFLYWKSVLTKDPQWSNELQAFAKAHPENREAASLSLKLSGIPYFTDLPEPGEASINILKQMGAKMTGESAGKFEIGLSALESPSTRLAIDLFLSEKAGGPRKAAIGVAQIQKRDPRVPRGQVDYVLWKYTGTNPEPAVLPPSEQVSSGIAQIAATPYDIQKWSEQGRQLVTDLKLKKVDDLLAVMVHPPQRPPETSVWQWIHLVQFAAALSIARFDAGWDNSVRRKALVSLLRGPMDWTTEAAIVAVTQLALDEKERLADVASLLLDVAKNMPKPGAVPYFGALRVCVAMLPLDKNTRIQFNTYLGK